MINHCTRSTKKEGDWDEEEKGGRHVCLIKVAAANIAISELKLLVSSWQGL